MPMQIWRSLFPQKGKQFSTSFRLFLGDKKIIEQKFSTPHQSKTCRKSPWIILMGPFRPNLARTSATEQ